MGRNACDRLVFLVELGSENLEINFIVAAEECAGITKQSGKQ